MANPQAEAYSVLAKHGIKLDDINTTADLAAVVRKLEPEDAASVINAFKFLRGKEVWKTDSVDGTIKSEDYTDKNYFKKNIWKASGHDNYPMTVWIYGMGKLVSIKVLGNLSAIGEIIKGSQIYYPQTEAILVSTKTKIPFLIYLSGASLKKPLRFQQEPFQTSLDEDPNFMTKIRVAIKKFAKPEQKQKIGFKAWYNTKTDEVMEVDNFSKSMNADPMRFGLASVGSSFLNMRIAAERNGWIAMGVEETGDGVCGFVQAMSNEQMIKGVQKLYSLRYEIKPWDALKISTNHLTKTIKKDEITSFLKSK